MACFNSEKTVASAIQSLQEQTLRDWELVIIDDGSTDSTPRILRAIAEADHRIRVLSQRNSGLTLSLIRGCAEARSAIIARQDADDLSLPWRLEQQYKLLNSCPEFGFVSCFADYIGPKNEYLSTVVRPADAEEATRKLLNEQMGPPAHGTVMFRKSVYESVGGYRSEFYYAQDSDLWLRMAQVSLIAYVRQSCYQFRWHVDSITGSGSRLQSEFGRLGQSCLKARKEHLPELPWLQQADALRASIVESRQQHSQPGLSSVKMSSQLAMTYMIASQLAQNDDPRARFYLREVLRKQPWHWRAWVRLIQSLIRRPRPVHSRQNPGH
jgi:glycosyltransferase involved in cell wall biosynthesis